jgi:hypothetical protein
VERDRKLELARRLRALLNAAQERHALRPSIEALSLWLSSPDWYYRLVSARHTEWIQAWASSDETSLRRALLAFVDPEEAAEARFAHFVEEAETAQAAGLIERQPESVLMFGSLFNFALEPDSLPVVRARPYESLEQALGYDPKIIERYENHRAFARELGAEMQRAGIPIRDMLDVQSLIFVSSDMHEFWEWDPPGEEATAANARAGPDDHRRDARPYLSVCSCLGYDTPYLLEWIEFHRLVGVERFFLYNNGDRQAQRELLAPYVEEGTVVLHDWPIFAPELPAREHCIQEHREDSRWIAFIDTDEFLFSPTERPLPEVLADYEAWPGVGVNWAMFGTSGHRYKPPGLVIESYLQMVHDRHIQSIVDPTRVIAPASPHRFAYRSGVAVDENFHPLTSDWTTYVSFSRLRINHYHTKSEEEFRVKCSRPQPSGRLPRGALYFERTMNRLMGSGQVDHAILGYLPALRKLLARAPAAIARSGGS